MSMANDNTKGHNLGHAQYMTKREAAEYMNLSYPTVHRLIRDGKLKACRPTGRVVRIERGDIDQYMTGTK